MKQRCIIATMDMQKKQIDWSLGQNLVAGDLALATTLLRMLLQELPQSQKLLKTLYQQEDWKPLEEQLHKLHGGSSYCGVPYLKEYSAQLEKIVSTRALSAIGPVFEKLNHCIDALLAEAKHDPRLQSDTDQDHKS